MASLACPATQFHRGSPPMRPNSQSSDPCGDPYSRTQSCVLGEFYSPTFIRKTPLCSLCLCVEKNLANIPRRLPSHQLPRRSARASDPYSRISPAYSTLLISQPKFQTAIRQLKVSPRRQTARSLRIGDVGSNSARAQPEAEHAMTMLSTEALSRTRNERRSSRR